MAELMYKIANEEAPDIRAVRRDTPDQLARVVALALNKKPEARYQDGDKFAADLKALIDLSPTQAGFDKTLQMSRSHPTLPQSADADATVVVRPASAQRTTGYDATQKVISPPSADDPFEKTAVMRRGATGDSGSTSGTDNRIS